MTAETLPRRRGFLSNRWLVGGVALIVVLLVGIWVMNGGLNRNQGAVTGPATVAATRGNIVARIAGSGAVAAEQALDLPFQTSGSVKEVLVKAGDTVTAGQPLAKLDDRTLRLQVSTDEANLRNAQLKLEQAKKGAETTDLASAQARLDAAKSAFNALSVGPTAAEIEEAQSRIRSAQAQLDKVRAGATSADIQDAQARVASAQAQFDKVRSGPTETDIANGKQRVESAKNALWGAQGNRDGICGRTKDPDQDPSCTQARATVQQQEAQVQIAENDLAKLLAGPDANDVTVAEQSLRQAQAALAKVRTINPNDVIVAEQTLKQAQVNLQKLQQGPTEDQIAQSQANITQAQAALDKLLAGPNNIDVQVAQIAVDQATIKLEQSRLNLENTTLTAPFAGIITTVNMVPGSIVNSATPAVKMIDRSILHIDLKLSENDVARVQIGQPVELTIDSLSGWKTQGQVSYVAPAAETNNGVVTYVVRVSFPDADPMVKVGMTANISITTAQKDSVVMVPNTALLPKGAGRVVQVVNAEGKTTEVEVQTGLSDGTRTEIISGLSEGDRVVALPVIPGGRGIGGPFGG